MKASIAALLLLVATLSGCGNEQDAATQDADTPTDEVVEDVVRDVAYYVENREEREAVIQECGNNPGELANTPNCVNASEAARRSRSQEMREAIERGE